MTDEVVIKVNCMDGYDPLAYCKGYETIAKSKKFQPTPDVAKDPTKLKKWSSAQEEKISAWKKKLLAKKWTEEDKFFKWLKMNAVELQLRTEDPETNPSKIQWTGKFDPRLFDNFVKIIACAVDHSAKVEDGFMKDQKLGFFGKIGSSALLVKFAKRKDDGLVKTFFLKLGAALVYLFDWCLCGLMTLILDICGRKLPADKAWQAFEKGLADFTDCPEFNEMKKQKKVESIEKLCEKQGYSRDRFISLKDGPSSGGDGVGPSDPSASKQLDHVVADATKEAVERLEEVFKKDKKNKFWIGIFKFIVQAGVWVLCIFLLPVILAAAGLTIAGATFTWAFLGKPAWWGYQAISTFTYLAISQLVCFVTDKRNRKKMKEKRAAASSYTLDFERIRAALFVLSLPAGVNADGSLKDPDTMGYAEWAAAVMRVYFGPSLNDDMMCMAKYRKTALDADLPEKPSALFLMVDAFQPHRVYKTFDYGVTRTRGPEDDIDTQLEEAASDTQVDVQGGTLDDVDDLLTDDKLSELMGVVDELLEADAHDTTTKKTTTKAKSGTTTTKTTGCKKTRGLDEQVEYSRASLRVFGRSVWQDVVFLQVLKEELVERWCNVSAPVLTLADDERAEAATTLADCGPALLCCDAVDGGRYLVHGKACASNDSFPPAKPKQTLTVRASEAMRSSGFSESHIEAAKKILGVQTTEELVANYKAGMYNNAPLGLLKFVRELAKE
mmetsp:Transcript_42488/g.107204  ORF Transcript_42488/g.107204 Transcript_42488/m.107204 type:complete len:724 (+) Transcript_42488:149-2320(+)